MVYNLYFTPSSENEMKITEVRGVHSFLSVVDEGFEGLFLIPTGLSATEAMQSLYDDLTLQKDRIMLQRDRIRAVMNELEPTKK
jgi:hypothetical protein